MFRILDFSENRNVYFRRIFLTKNKIKMNYAIFLPKVICGRNRPALPLEQNSLI